jgi:Protein of unknown function (DUF3293)
VTADRTIDPSTLQAYRETDYRVFGSEPFVLHVGVRSPELLSLHDSSRTPSSAFVTAYNPRGVITAEAANERRLGLLQQEIARRGWTAIEGLGRHPTGDWPGEPSYLVLGPSRGEAQALGQLFEQNAIIWSGANAVPELLLCYLGDL